MAASPPKEPDVEQTQSGEEEGDMSRQDEGQGGGLGDFEVKEQDRWLPIANEVQHVPDDSATTQKTQQAKYVHSSTLLLLLSHDSHTHALDSSEPARGTSTIQIMSSDFSPPASPDSKNGHHHHAASDANIRNFAPVARIMKTALPDNAKIAKEAKECMQECVSEFISFITSEASEKCQQEKRKTVNGEDILFAMTSLGFENYAEALKIYLSKYRETQSTRAENQNRPTSSGGFQSGGPVGGAAGSANAAGGYAGNQQNTMSPSQGLDTGDQDAAGAYYGGVAPGHNGIGGDGY
ncbi:hypothetical protein H2198_001397 [Neophaeococcomyces mojaviensis]|uniref:Uncharacterized protein n=1 Tax=Neophaeococcomyces mojaviensis TaxID=3383035 RepID=A0ACC3AHD6_9EURO|nr:hypothetical protein H2198_001397 [Knufia sp. JES_112]